MKRSTTNNVIKMKRKEAKELNIKNGIAFNKSYFGQKKRGELKIIKGGKHEQAR